MPDNNFPEKRPANMPPFKYMYNMFDWGPLPIADEETGDYETVDYISRQLQKTHDKPFFLAAGIYRPHLPWFVPQEYFDQHPLETIRKPAVLENDASNLGDVAKEIITRGGNYHKHVVEAGQWEKAIQGYLASISFADAMVGRLLEALANSPHADNTIVVIWSDHGWQLGEKSHWRKFALWENTIRTVFMMKVPEGLEKMPGGSDNGIATDNLTSLLDIYPTLVDLCNLEDDPEEWHNLAQDTQYGAVKTQMAGYIPKEQIDLPEVSLIELMEHHVPPFRSKAYFFSEERKQWMQRFE